MTARDAYVVLTKASGIQVGDTVRVWRKARSGECGWDNCWVATMDGFVGQTCRVLGEDDGTGFPLELAGFPLELGGGCRVPFFVLEKLSYRKVTMAEVNQKFGEPVEIVGDD